MREYFGKSKKVWLPLSAFLITGGILCLVYGWFGLFPFGEKTLAWGDMKQQVIPLMLEFKDILAGKSGFLLNFQNAGGMSFWGVFFFFLSSPFTFLVAVIEKGDIYFLVNVLVMAKLSLSAAAASLFFQEEQPKLENMLHLFFCLSYAFCGYGLLYYQNIVWLDVLCLFPVLMLGFQRVIHCCKGVIFTISLAAMVVVNYYLSYMVFLALILLAALFVKNCVPKERRGAVSGKIGVCSALALVLTAVVWLPSLLQCLRSARTSQGIVETIQSGGIFTELSTTLPVFLCTAGLMALAALTPFFPKTPKRKTLLQLLFLTSLPLVLEPVNKLWHTGSYQAFPARYGYIPVFLGLWCLADVLGEKKIASGNAIREKKGEILLIAVVLLLFVSEVLILTLHFHSITSYTQTLWFDNTGFFFLAAFSVLAAFAVWLAVYLWRKGKIHKSFMAWILLPVCLLQGSYHSAMLIGAAANSPEWGQKILQTEGALADPALYRVKQGSKFCDVNLLGASGFLTLNHYTSLTDERFLHAMKKLGFSSYWMETSACCGTGFSDILLSNKYSLTKALTWEKTGSGNLGYILPEGVLPEALPEGNRLSLQNNLYRYITGEQNNLFQEYRPTRLQEVKIEREDKKTTVRRTGEVGRIVYEITVRNRETLYFDAFYENTNRLREPINNTFHITVNGKTIEESYPNQSCNGILELGSFEKETLQIVIAVKKDAGCLNSFGVYGAKTDKLLYFTSRLRNADLQTERSRVVGTAETKSEGESLFLTVPYAPGIKITVNEKSVTPKIVLDCFLEISLEPGTNHITLSFIPQGVKAGAVLSAFGIAASLLLLIFRKRIKGKTIGRWHRLAAPLLTAAFYCELLLIYLAPMLIFFGKYL